jgi:hypothetical protein
MINRRNFIAGSVTGIASTGLLSRRVIAAEEETLCVNVEAGADSNSGTKLSPLKTLGAAARRINESQGTGPATIIVAEGIYALDHTVLFKPARQYTKTDRLTIRAESLPDDPDWGPARMPVIIPVMPLSKTWMGRADPFGESLMAFRLKQATLPSEGSRFSACHITSSRQKDRSTVSIRSPGRAMLWKTSK